MSYFGERGIHQYLILDSKQIAVDLDKEEDGELMIPTEFPAWIDRTPSGGVHLIFKGENLTPDRILPYTVEFLEQNSWLRFCRIFKKDRIIFYNQICWEGKELVFEVSSPVSSQIHARKTRFIPYCLLHPEIWSQYRHTHQMRIYLSAALKSQGYTEDEAVEIFKIFPDFREHITRGQLRNLWKEEYLFPNCATIQLLNPEWCEQCKNERYRERYEKFRYFPGIVEKYTRGGYTSWYIKSQKKHIVVFPTHRLMDEFQAMDGLDIIRFYDNKKECLSVPENHLLPYFKTPCIKCPKKSGCELFTKRKQLENSQFDICLMSYARFIYTTIPEDSPILFDEFFSSVFSLIVPEPETPYPKLKEIENRLREIKGKENSVIVLNPPQDSILESLAVAGKMLNQNYSQHISFLSGTIYFIFRKKKYNITAFYKLGDFIRQNSHRVCLVDAVSIPMFGLKKMVLKDPFSSDSFFVFKSYRGENVDRKIYKNITTDPQSIYYRATYARGISLINEGVSSVLIEELPHIPDEVYLMRMELLKIFNIFLSVEQLKNLEMFNALYQLVSRYKKDFHYFTIYYYTKDKGWIEKFKEFLRNKY